MGNVYIKICNEWKVLTLKVQSGDIQIECDGVTEIDSTYSRHFVAFRNNIKMKLNHLIPHMGLSDLCMAQNKVQIQWNSLKVRHYSSFDRQHKLMVKRFFDLE